jgi:uncharacterized membrane protein HdeD (DUF308 family)
MVENKKLFNKMVEKTKLSNKNIILYIVYALFIIGGIALIWVSSDDRKKTNGDDKMSTSHLLMIISGMLLIMVGATLMGYLK